MRFLLGLCIGAGFVFGAALLMQRQQDSITPTERTLNADSARSQQAPAAEVFRASEPSTTVIPENTAAAPDDSNLQPQLIKPPIMAASPTATDPLPDLDTPEVIPSAEEPSIKEPSAAQLASVWAPFHSEASATGFARRLEAELDQSFTVHRAGPANYHVVFPFANEQHRLRVTEQIARVTGMPQP